MRKLFIVLASIFAVLGIILTVFPTEQLALIPIGLALTLAFLALRKSEGNQSKFPKLILVVAALTLLTVVGKEVFIKDEIVVDKQFDQKKVESKKEAQKDLEELEDLE